jgi:histidine triad (HIT) family protein
MKGCVFCTILRGEASAQSVYEDAHVLAFLDVRPLFPGHTLVVPKAHHETLGDLPPAQLEPLFTAVRMLSTAVEAGLGAEGTFVAMNNRVSQSVPHLHVHIVPRRKGDGLRGFFWPRHKYESDEAMGAVAARIRGALPAR